MARIRPGAFLGASGSSLSFQGLAFLFGFSSVLPPTSLRLRMLPCTHVMLFAVCSHALLLLYSHWLPLQTKCHPTRSISTGRMEALGLLRMLEFLQRPSWKGPATLQLDNETVAKKPAGTKTPAPHTGLWLTMISGKILDPISSPTGRWSGSDPTQRTRRSCQQTRG